MSRVKILDCTLRDGGYYTNWDFPNVLVEDYYDAMRKLPIDIIELGYVSKPLPGYFGKFFYCHLDLLGRAKSETNKKIAVLVDEKNLEGSSIDKLKICPTVIDLVRVAVHPGNIDRAKILSENLKKAGFNVALNVMYMSSWANYPAFKSSLVGIEDIVDILYMVDSFGGVYPTDIKNRVLDIRDVSKVDIGFHGHNNLELALINTLTAIESGVSYIDSTITGMGRGAGNLRTELLLSVLRSKGNVLFSFDDLTGVVDRFTGLQEKYHWGSNLAYIVSGANSLPQKEVMEWVNKRFYSFNSVIRALESSASGKTDNVVFSPYQSKTNYDVILIVGGGNSVRLHQNAILTFLSNNSNVLVINASSKNCDMLKSAKVKHIFCLLGNEGIRLENTLGEKEIDAECVLPPPPRKMGTHIPSRFKNNAFQLQKREMPKLVVSHTSLALEIAMHHNPKTVYFVGYDGYSEMKAGVKEQELMIENDAIFKYVSNKGLVLKSLTKTSYKNLNQESVYANI